MGAPRPVTDEERFIAVVKVVRRLVITLIIVTVVSLTVNGVARFQVHRENESIESTEESVEIIKDFVETLKEPPTEDEIAQQRAVTEAVRLVPSIKDILCEEFPEATGCQS